MNETELLHTFRETGSETAFAALVRHYAGLVFSVARRRVADPALAEDVTQMVFLRLAQSPPNVSDPARLAAWLHRTTLNVAIDTWRKESRRQAREQTAVMESNPSTTNHWEEISPHLDEALNQLTDADRQVLLLRFFEQNTMRNVGAILGVSEDAAKMRVSRAVDRLRRQLGSAGTAGTSAVLAALLMERAVEAVPVALVARLAALKLPAAATAGTGIGLAAFRHSLAVKVAAGAAVLVLAVLVTWRLGHLAHAAQSIADSVQLTSIVSAPPPGDSPPPPSKMPVTRPVAAPPSAPAMRMYLRVVDAETGVGLAGTKIHVACFGPGGAGESHDLFTDFNGELAIPNPEDATKNQGMNLFAIAERYVPLAVRFPDPAQPTNYLLKLAPAQTVAGRILDVAGQPVAGVAVMVQGPGDQLGHPENMDFQLCSATSDDQGKWSFNYLPKNLARDFYRNKFDREVRFVLTKQDYAVTQPVVPESQTDLTSLTFVINRGFAVTGRITDTNNRPLAGARVQELHNFGYRHQSAKTDDTGGFTLNGVANYDNYESGRLDTNGDGVVIIRNLTGTGEAFVNLSVQMDGYESQTHHVLLAAPTNSVHFTLLPGHILRGRVVDEAGVPINHVVVQTDYDFTAQIPKRFEWNMKTEWDGLFEWDSAPAEPVCYWFEAAGYEPLRGYRLLADNTHHEIVLKKVSAH